jgi:hypothetical protein
MRGTIATFSAVAVVTVAVAAAVVTMARDSGAPTPEGTVRDFLVAAVVEHNGVFACTYLTPRAAREISAVEPRDTPCEVALDDSRLTLGPDVVHDEAAIKRLSYRQERRGGLARVTVGAGGAARTFSLRKTTAQAPLGPAHDTPWRIDSGAAALVEPAGAGSR